MHLNLNYMGSLDCFLDVEVEISSVHEQKEIVGSRGIRIVANSTIPDVRGKQYDLIVVGYGLLSHNPTYHNSLTH